MKTYVLEHRGCKLVITERQAKALAEWWKKYLEPKDKQINIDDLDDHFGSD